MKLFFLLVTVTCLAARAWGFIGGGGGGGGTSAYSANSGHADSVDNAIGTNLAVSSINSPVLEVPLNMYVGALMATNFHCEGVFETDPNWSGVHQVGTDGSGALHAISLTLWDNAENQTPLIELGGEAENQTGLIHMDNAGQIFCYSVVANFLAGVYVGNINVSQLYGSNLNPALLSGDNIWRYGRFNTVGQAQTISSVITISNQFNSITASNLELPMIPINTFVGAVWTLTNLSTGQGTWSNTPAFPLPGATVFTTGPSNVIGEQKFLSTVSFSGNVNFGAGSAFGLTNQLLCPAPVSNTLFLYPSNGTLYVVTTAGTNLILALPPNGLISSNTVIFTNGLFIGLTKLGSVNPMTVTDNGSVGINNNATLNAGKMVGNNLSTGLGDSTHTFSYLTVSNVWVVGGVALTNQLVAQTNLLTGTASTTNWFMQNIGGQIYLVATNFNGGAVGSLLYQKITSAITSNP